MTSTETESTGSSAVGGQLPEDAIPIVPTRGFVLFPGAVVPLTIGRPRSVATAQAAVRENRQVGVILQRDADTAEPTLDQLCSIGVIADVLRYVTDAEGTHHLIVQGQQRFRVADIVHDFPFLAARVTRIDSEETPTPELDARFLNLRNTVIELPQLFPQLPPPRNS